mmetsp:Transcript_12280/g.36044  ORF Transcript_12280/g.36044 Transcript_12280/m.36044 type:complete len:155 (+) Transcript_12280:116-580(+)
MFGLSRAAVVLAALAAPAVAFQAPKSNPALVNSVVGGSEVESSTELYESTKQPSFIPMPKEISYGEESRKYRRTVYTHDDWVKHRAPDRFLRNSYNMFTSGIYKNIGNEAGTCFCRFCRPGRVEFPVFKDVRCWILGNISSSALTLICRYLWNA